MKQKFLKILSVEHLKSLCNKEEPIDCFIALNFGIVSRKEICITKSGRFDITNCIDETTQKLSAKQLMDERYTNIGKAITLGAFFQAIY